MPYRTTRRTTEARQRQVDAMARGREAARLAGAEREPVQALPMLRRVLIVIDYDSGQPVEHRIQLYRTSRVDVYRATADGQDWGRRGWSAVLEGLRKSLPRRLSVRALASYWAPRHNHSHTQEDPSK